MCGAVRKAEGDIMSLEWILGFIVGIVIVALVCLVGKKVILQQSGRSGVYDERQLVLRGRAFTVAYATLLVWLAAWMALSAMELPAFPGPALVMTGVLLSIAVFCGYCIFHDAYFKTADQPRSWVIFMGLAALLNLGIGAGRLFKGDTLQARLFENYNLMVGLMLVAVVACTLVKLAMDRRGEGD